MFIYIKVLQTLKLKYILFQLNFYIQHTQCLVKEKDEEKEEENGEEEEDLEKEEDLDEEDPFQEHPEKLCSMILQEGG